MEDHQIVALYWDRNELAIRETEAKYGRWCHTIARNILVSREDAEECVNDTWWAAWDRIPPNRPAILSSFLAKITRRISLNKWRSRTAAKRGGGEVPLALEELSEVIAGGYDAEHILQQKELEAAIRNFVAALPETERDVFVCRYFLLAPLSQISQKFGFSMSKTKSMLFRTRQKLRTYLNKEGLL